MARRHTRKARDPRNRPRWFWLIAPGLSDQARELLEGQRLEAVVARAGLWGPVMIVGFMTAAVVGSLIPSAPIAQAAGAAYGHVWGSVLVVVGAELGALHMG